MVVMVVLRLMVHCMKSGQIDMMCRGEISAIAGTGFKQAVLV